MGIVRPVGEQADRVARRSAAPSTTFDWATALLGAWFVGGIFLDGWAHHHVATLETFFTPWHAVLYSGFFAVATLTALQMLRNRRVGFPWRHALPPGYERTPPGVLIFLIAGLGDLLWHTLFGIEQDVAALLSPTHLALALGAALIVAGPDRAASHRLSAGPTAARWIDALPALLSLAFLLSVITFITQFAHPWVYPLAGEHSRQWSNSIAALAQTSGIGGFLLQSSLLAGLILATLDRWTPPRGGFTLVVGLNAVLLSVLRDQTRFIPAALLVGLAIDLLAWAWRPTAARPWPRQMVAAAVAAMVPASTFGTLALTEGIWWSVHLWVGTICLAGAAGWMLATLHPAPGPPASAPAEEIFPSASPPPATERADDHRVVVNRW